MEKEKINLSENPESGFSATMDFLSEIAPAQVAPVSQTPAVTDRNGVEFDPAIHKVDENGIPKLGSKSQFLLKKEAKKSASQRIKDGMDSIFQRKKQENDEISEKSEIPLSDHELPEPGSERPESGPLMIGNYTASAQIAAEATFLGYAAFLGNSVYDHRSEFFPRVCEIMQAEEERTGRAMPIPAWAVTPIALVQVGAQIAQTDERCRKSATEKIEMAKKIFLTSSVKKSIFAKFKKAEKSDKKEGQHDD